MQTNTIQEDVLQVSPESLRALHWELVTSRLAHHAMTDVGRALLLNVPLSTCVSRVTREYAAVHEWMDLRRLNLAPGLGSCSEIGQAVGRVGEGRILTGEEMVQLGEALRTTSHIRASLQANSPETHPMATALGHGMPDGMPLAKDIQAAFDGTGSLRDSASRTLAALRKKKQSLLQSTKRRMEDFIHSHELQPMLQDSYYTVREERFVLPVKAQDRPMVSGIIHGSSGTGSTVFVEPQEMVDANNSLLLLHEDILREEEVLLRKWTERLLGQMELFEALLDQVAKVDQWNAKARLGDEIQGTVPEVELLGETHLLNARNPVLALRGLEVVPNTLTFGENDQFLVVTGPNTGGKTITLVTLGLMTLMSHAGIPIPAEPGSKIALFPRLFTLFGDPQNIETDMSTFSGQLERLSQVLGQAGPGSFVLMDEPVVGTEPAGGAALAIAILEYLAEQGARGAVTTHYDRLKTLSLEDSRFENASVGLDAETMTPTYELRFGVAGSSSPIEMAQRLGLRASVIARARELTGDNRESLHKALESLEKQKRGLAKAEAAARQQEQELKALKARLVSRGKEEARATQQEVLKLLNEARSMASAAIRAIQTEPNQGKIQRTQKRLDNLVSKASAVLPCDDETTNKASRDEPELKPFAWSDIKPGATVYLKEHGKKGLVTRQPDSPKRIEVSIGALRIKVSLEDLTHPPALHILEKPTRRPGAEPQNRDLPPQVPDYTLDLRGARVDDALDSLRARLDKATLEGKHALYLIHGHGTGALKKALRVRLDRSPYVAEWESADAQHGGDGVTVIFLKD